MLQDVFAKQHLKQTCFYAVDQDCVPSVVAVFPPCNQELLGSVTLAEPELVAAEVLARGRYDLDEADKKNRPGWTLELPAGPNGGVGQWLPHEAFLLCPGLEPDGFEIRGLPLSDLLRLGISHRENSAFEVEPATFSPGSTDLVIRRRRAH